MSARAPEAIQQLWDDVSAKIPRAKLGGIVGDTAHSFGYHLARRDLPSGDYSAQLAKDRQGASDCASALDVTLPSDLMLVCTRRLHAAAVNKDPRLAALREFCGTLDGARTYPWDLSSNTSEGLDTWDDSHLWHIHLSFFREYADNYAALAPIADVIAGIDPAPEELMVTAADEAKIRAIVRAEIVDAFKDYTRDDSDPASQQSPGHYMKTIISNEVRQAIPAIAKATADAVKAGQ